MSSQSYFPLSRFQTSTRFAINPDRIFLLESGYFTGCIEVDLVNYKYQDQRTMPGGNGLALAGALDAIIDGYRLDGRLALIAGFDEVFVLVSQNEGCVVLRPLGVGLGVRWQLAEQYSRKTSRKRRNQKKYAQRARKFLASMRQRIDLLTGTLPGLQRRAAGPFFLRERTQGWQSETPIRALTVHQARFVAQSRVERMKVQGWECGQESCRRGNIEDATENTVAWLCQRWGASKWVSVECGTPEPMAEEDRKWGAGAFKEYSAADITEMCAAWANFNGFTGEHCGRCRSDANVFACGPGWHCACGHYNNQSWSNSNMPHELPDYGPSRAVILEGVAQHRRNKGEIE